MKQAAFVVAADPARGVAPAIARPGILERLNRTDFWLFAVFLVVLGINVGHYLPFFTDDSLISLRYSERLLTGHGLTWTDGPRVEGYTNLLWVLGVAALGKLGLGLIFASRCLGVLCAAGAGLAILRLPVAGARWAQDAGKLTALTLFAISATTAVWAIGGLEQPLLAAGLAWALLGAARLAAAEAPDRRVAAGTGVALAIMCLTRPDSPLFVVTIATALVLGSAVQRRKVDWLTILIVVGIPLATYLAQMLFRHAYYGEWVPNTARVKFKPSPEHLVLGMQYLKNGFGAGYPLYLAGLVSVGQLLRSRRYTIALALLSSAAAWCLYVSVIGGDIFPTFRHLTPLVVLSATAIALGGGDILFSLKRWFGIVPIPLLSFSMVCVQTFSGEVRRAEFERFEWQGRDLALTLKDAFGARRPVMAVTAAGCLPFWSQFDCIDMLGLNDAYLAKHPPKSFGKGWIGHELGSGAYIFARRPDLIVYNIGTLGDPFRTGQELDANPKFRHDYTPVVFRVRSAPEFEATVWMDRYSPKVGYRKTADALTVPGYLVNANKNSRVKAAPDGTLATDVEPPTPAQITLEKADLPPLPYAVRLVGDGAARLACNVTITGDIQITVSADSPAGYRLREVVIEHVPSSR